MTRPDPKTLIGKDVSVVPASCQRVMAAVSPGEHVWVGPGDAEQLSEDVSKAYNAAHGIMAHLCVQAPAKHASGHPGGPLSSFTFAYALSLLRDPAVDQPLRYSAGHLSLLAYGLQWMFGREGKDARLQTPQSIIDTFRIPSGLPGHVEAGIGDIPFGTGPLGKGVSHGLGTAFGLQLQKKPGIVDVLLADGDSQEGQVAEAVRLAGHLGVANLMVHGDFNDIQLSGLPTKTVAADLPSIALACGWNVVEVQNGNDLGQVMGALKVAAKLCTNGRPTFVCYYTTMGNGISFMEQGSNDGTKNYHGSPLSKEECEKALSALPSLETLITDFGPFRDKEKKRYAAKEPTQTDIALSWKLPAGYARAVTDKKGAARKDFGATHLLALMKADPRIIVLHADLAASGGFDKVEKELPGRVINVGVAEANMVMMAAGMRQAGLLPVTYTFAAFGTNEARASARLIDINCGHTRCGVIHDCTHSGISVGEDGETHQEQNYLNLPYRHTRVWMPADSNQAAAMAEKAMEIIAEGHESVFVFSPRSNHEQLKTPKGDVMYGKEYVFDGAIDMVRGAGDTTDRVTVLATGYAVHDALAAADALADGSLGETVQVRVLNVSCIRPIDASAVIQAALETRHLVVAEDHNTEGGLASQVSDIIADFALPCSLCRLGHTQFYPSGTDEELRLIAGIDKDSIVDAVQDELRTEVRGGEDALVSCIYELLHNQNHSRFSPSVQPLVDRLIEEKGYLERLREYWAALQAKQTMMPTTEKMRKLLEDRA